MCCMKYTTLFILAVVVNGFAQDYQILEHNQPITIVPLPQLNTPERECNISILPSGNSLFFMSTRAMKGGRVGNGDLFQSDFINNAWQTPVPITSINTDSGEDEPTFSSNGKEMYFQSWANDWRSLGGPYYHAEKKHGQWVNTGSMGTNINRFFAMQAQAHMGYGTDGMAVSADGNLFIVACGPNYNGPMDMYYSVKNSDGWSFPKLMGISTEGDERSVFIAADNRTIYFSSDGMGGFGGLDIFKVEINENGKLGDPINIGAPFNTPNDDMGFVASADGKSAFFIRNLDIYFADISLLTEEIKPVITDTKEPTDEPISSEPQNPKKMVIEPITVYFDHDKDNLTPHENSKLVNLPSSLAPIHIHGFCDADGSSDYNMNLAKRRCETVKNQLVERGIQRELIEIHVHGENDPAATNKTEIGKAANRRVIIKMD